MTRFNYLGDRRRADLAGLGTTLAIDNRIRGPLAALIVILLATTATGLAQLGRFATAHARAAANSARLAADGAELAQIDALRARLAAKRRLLADITTIREAGLAQTAQLAWIGDHLPADMWLRSVRFENGGYMLDGTADRIAAVGTAILALRAAGPLAVPRLVSLRDEPEAGAHVRYTVRLEPRP